MGDRRGVYRLFMGNMIGTPKHRREDNIKIDLQEVGGSGMDWIKVAQDRDRSAPWRIKY
jgi:hypothetical protein